MLPSLQPTAAAQHSLQSPAEALGTLPVAAEVADPGIAGNAFAIINNRKRAIIALIHSLFFLAVATVQLAISHASPFSAHGKKIAAGIVLLTIYVIVTGVLIVLLRFSRCIQEKLYFALCAASAGFGLVRILLGDPVLHANLARVLLLLCAVVTGTGILRNHATARVGLRVE